MTVYTALTTTPRTKKELAARLGWSPREVEQAINEARLKGAPIVSDERGYRITVHASEVRACADRLRHRILVQARTERALRRCAQRLDGVEQERLWAA